ncbi:MAG: sigma 54-interacting transcriptional regulator [Polyangia bacterium]|jgi:Nif-specific regulatory protein
MTVTSQRSMLIPFATEACQTCRAGAIRHLQALEALAAVAKTLASSSSQEDMLREILMVLEERLAMRRSTVMLLSSDGSELHVEALRADGTRPSDGARYRRGEGILGRVVESGSSLVIPSIEDEPRFQDRVHRRKGGALDPRGWSFIAVPVALGQEIVGTLSVDLPKREVELLQDAERVLAIVAGLIAGDIKRRRELRAETAALQDERQRLISELTTAPRPDNMVGDAAPMRAVYARMHQVAQADTTVLIRGESGTGKELVAAAIHYLGPRARGPFVKVNCSALSENLLESELFGHEKGAFTSALSARTGRFEEADGGTLFLDEIGDFSPGVQVKLLRIIQERELERVGSNKTIRVNVRLLAATNRDLEALMKEGRFRPDLYYRINVFPVMLPPLRERKEDILALANHFAQKFAIKMHKPIERIATPAIDMLTAYHWPGNIRELENCMEHAVLLSHDGIIFGRDLPPTLQMPAVLAANGDGSLRTSVAQLEHDMLVDALKRAGGNVSAAGRELGVGERMLRYKIRKLAIDLTLIAPGRRRRA